MVPTPRREQKNIRRSIEQPSLTAWRAGAGRDKPENGDLGSYDSAKPGKKRILVIDHHLPMPDRDSGSLRMFKILSILYRLGHHVTFLPDNLADIPSYADKLAETRHRSCPLSPYQASVREYLQRRGTAFDVVILESLRLRPKAHPRRPTTRAAKPGRL